MFFLDQEALILSPSLQGKIELGEISRVQDEFSRVLASGKTLSLLKCTLHLYEVLLRIVFQKYVLQQGFRLSFVLTLFLIFQKISGSWSQKILLVKKNAVIQYYFL